MVEASIECMLVAGKCLDRIRIDRTHIVGSIDPVNPVYTYNVEQIGVDGIADGDSHQPRSALADVASSRSAMGRTRTRAHFASHDRKSPTIGHRGSFAAGDRLRSPSPNGRRFNHGEVSGGGLLESHG